MLYKEVVEKISVGVEKKLKQKEYLKEGLFEVVDQGQSLVGGFSNDSSLVVKCDLPVIIFGDHTKCVKFIDFPFIAGADGVKVLRAKECVDAKFLYYYTLLLTKKMIDKGYARHYQFLEKMEVDIPSVDKQKRIVNKIEELFSELDSAVETLKKTKEQLTIYRQSVLKEAFEACLQSETLKDVCSCITDGDHMPPPKASSGIPFVMISDVKNNTIQWDDTAFVKRDYFEKLDKKRVPQKGDVLYTVTGSFGIPIIVDYEKEFCFQRHIALLRPNLTKIEQKYLFYVMQSPQIFQQASDVATGTAQKTVGLTVLRTINIPYDNIQQQRKIVNHIESRLSACENIEKTVNEALMQADAMRQSILKKAFEGSL